ANTKLAMDVQSCAPIESRHDADRPSRRGASTCDDRCDAHLCPKLKCFGQMLRADGVVAGEIGNRSRDSQDARHGTSGQSQPLHAHLEYALGTIVRSTTGDSQRPAFEMRVESTLTLSLPITRGQYTDTHRSARFRGCLCA